MRQQGIWLNAASEAECLRAAGSKAAVRLDAVANTLAPALAELHSMGFAVWNQDGAGL